MLAAFAAMLAVACGALAAGRMPSLCSGGHATSSGPDATANPTQSDNSPINMPASNSLTRRIIRLLAMHYLLAHAYVANVGLRVLLIIIMPEEPDLNRLRCVRA